MAAEDTVNPAQFTTPGKPSLLNVKMAGHPDAVQQHADNIVKTYNTATSEEKHSGYGWYAGAHREATRLAMSSEPGAQHPAKEGKRSVYTHGPSEAATHRQAGNIAALSPTMDWNKNVQAAKDVHGLSGDQVGKLRQSVAMGKQVQDSARALKKMPQGTPEHAAATEAHNTMQSASVSLKAEARAPLKGKALNLQSGENILKAHNIHSGALSPEEALPITRKTGQFYQQIANPRSSAGGATVDYRSHDIAMGAHHPLDADRGLTNQKRYDHFQEAHRVAAQTISQQSGLPHSPHQVQAITWVADKRAMLGSGGGGKHRHGEAIHNGVDGSTAV